MTKGHSITEQILSVLREEIVNCKYDDYALITEGEISTRFQVSKTPAREALNFLCQEGLLEKLPHRGYLVRGLTMRELENLFQFRCILETAAVELTIGQASDQEIAAVCRLAERRVPPEEPEPYLHYSALNVEFHLALAQLGRNPILVATLQTVLNQLRRALTMDWKCADVNALLQGHSALMEAVSSRDLERSKHLIARECTCTESRIFVRERRYGGEREAAGYGTAAPSVAVAGPCE